VSVRFVSLAKNAFYGVVHYAYQHSGVQFHPALYVLLYSAAFIAMLVPLYWLISVATSISLSVKWEVVAMFAGLVASAELVRGHVQAWRKDGDDNWSPVAIAAGGGTAGLILWALTAFPWGHSRWAEPFESVVFGAGAYLVLGWLIQCQARQAKESK
jgi:hypothetical protein